MSINQIIIYIMVFFMALGGIDKILGNKFGYGKEFDQGFMTAGPLALAMLGIISLAPVLAVILKPILSPLYAFLGADPAMFAGTLLAPDMGGYSLALELAQTPEIGVFSGLILSSMMGATLVFTLPVALGIIEKDDCRFLAKGVLIGICTIPLGCLIGGLVAGFDLNMILPNITPIIIVAFLISLGMWRFPETMIRGFGIFTQGVMMISTLGLVAITIETLTGVVVIPGMTPISEGILIIGSIIIVLAGAFPMIHFINTVFKKPLIRMGKLLGIGDKGATGIISSLAHNIATFGMFKDMSDRGKVLNSAFAVSASFVFGGHLGFVAGVNPEMIFPVIVGKLSAGISALIIAGRMDNTLSNKGY